MSGPWGSEGPADDAAYLARLRELLDDLPVPADEQFSPTGTATKFKCTQLRVNDDKYFSVLVSGVAQTPVPTRDQVSGGNFWIDFNTGLIIFGTAPVVGTNTVVVNKSKVRWRDSVLMQALYGGLLFLYPQVWRDATDTSVTMQTNQWDYQLPADFEDPRVFIKSVMIREIPGSMNRFQPIIGHTRDRTTIRLPRSQYFSPGSTLEIQYTAPYRNLSDVEPQAADIPIWYAAAQLLGFAETKRTRADGQTVSADTNAQPPGFQQNTGAWYMSQANALLKKLGRAMPMAQPVSTLDV